VKDVIGAPNGSGEWAVPTQQADAAMTPQHMEQTMNFLMFLMAPQNEGSYVNNSSQGSDIPLIKGAAGPNVPGLGSLFPRTRPPVTVEGIMDAGLTNQASDQGNNLVQAYLNGNMSWSQFSTQFQSVLQQAAQQWAQQNKVNLNQYN
jgi:hypothetical protein